MNSPLLTKLTLAIATMAAALSSLAHTKAAPFPLSFQGCLTDYGGTPVPDGTKVIQLKIYDAPAGGTIVWSDEIQELTVNGGLVNTMLESRSDMSRLDFTRSLNLEITPAADNDDQITAADPPLFPRQFIVPAIFAATSETTCALFRP